MTKPLSIGIAGLGTVGAGVLRLLHDNAALIAARAGVPLNVTAVSARDRSRDRGISLDGLRWHDNPDSLAHDPAVDVVIELIGGAEGPARTLVEAALRAGKSVITANKALIAHHGNHLATLAETHQAAFRFESAVAGGIPIIKALREGLAANRIDAVAGIFNGTCNYILSRMRAEKLDFATVLADAQAQGYAEADPSFDIDGVDTAHKLAILAALAFGRPVDFASIHVEGIRRVSALDIAFADELGYRIKLLGIARATDAGIETRVHPAMVPLSAPLAHVDGVNNAVVINGDPVGEVVLQGRGAGAGPTASAVIADLIDLARNRTTPMLGVAQADLAALPSMPMDQHRGAYFLRLMVQDQPGVIADITAVLRDHTISLESMLQHGRSANQAVPVVLVTHITNEHAMRAALARLETLAAVLESPTAIRIESA
ncbi:MAG TPA: homoserine dehydrogenase [Acidiphilium sp.]|nr:MAG: homoserine dehydrogenase [Acidiphilium sp. 21-60-14]OYV90059.1 MAG: homoserine dehydrogenase [Acidiphilium sp. 37-60-79]HQT89253.1 homoserine dehydrogenase [Acidiphilium sp.]HQU24936.1 homoserine dehydrogenase [Acidiphilium sp.]